MDTPLPDQLELLLVSLSMSEHNWSCLPARNLVFLQAVLFWLISLWKNLKHWTISSRDINDQRIL